MKRFLSVWKFEFELRLKFFCFETNYIKNWENFIWKLKLSFFVIMQAVILVDPDSSIEVEKERQEYTQFTHYKQ